MKHRKIVETLTAAAEADIFYDPWFGATEDEAESAARDEKLIDSAIGAMIEGANLLNEYQRQIGLLLGANEFSRERANGLAEELTELEDAIEDLPCVRTSADGEECSLGDDDPCPVCSLKRRVNQSRVAHLGVLHGE